ELMTYQTDALPWIVGHDPIAVESHGDQVQPHHVADRTERLASALRARGMAARDRCLIWLESPIDITVAYIAVTAIDAVPVLIHPDLPGATSTAMVQGVPGISWAISADECSADLRSALLAVSLL